MTLGDLSSSSDSSDGLPTTQPEPDRKTATLISSPPPDVPTGAGDAIHTATALETGETEIWTNDRDLLAAFRPHRSA